MRSAYLLLVHNNPGQLRRLIQRLMAPNVDFYVHVDRKADLSPFLKELSLPQVSFIGKREKVNWGGYSIIQATVNGFKEIIASGKTYHYITLLSGQDYPIQSNGSIEKFFLQHPGKAFMSFASVEHEWQEALPRLNRYFLTDHPFPGSNKIEGWINKILPARKPPEGLVFVGRSQWFSITFEQLKYIVAVLQTDKRLTKYFRFTWGSDEFVFQTLLFNSSFKDEMVNDNLRYTDWSGGGASPKTLTIADKEAIAGSGKLFARKFDRKVDEKILDVLDSHTL